MANIINLDNFKKNKLANTQVLDFFDAQALTFQHFYYEGSDDLLVVVKKETYLFFFFEYIPEGTFTECPNIYDRFEDIFRTPHISEGEWVVFDVFSLKTDESLEILEKLNKKSNNIDFIKKMKEKIRGI